jgi:ferric-dicitrate binding protein FerR (iron transport regulator)
MTDHRDQPINETTLSQWIRELPPKEADPAFRAKLRADFAAGRLSEVARDEADRGAAISLSRWMRWAAPVAAVVVVLLAFVTLNRGPALRVADVTGVGEVVIDGERIAADDIGTLGERIDSGSDIEVSSDVTLDLTAGDIALYELVAGTQMTIPPSPGRWFGRAVACSLFVGEVRIKTGRDFAGTELSVYTPDGMVVVSGTLLSIQCDAGGTCVCVLQGTARVGVDENDLEAVEPGFRKIMLRDGTVDIIPVKPMHGDGVLDFDKRVGARIDGSQ